MFNKEILIFPQISRIIPSRVGFFLLKSFLWLIVTLTFFLNVMNFYSNPVSENKSPAEKSTERKAEENYLGVQTINENFRQEVEKEMSYWYDLINNYQGYTFAYHKLSSLLFSVGNKEQGDYYLGLIPKENNGFRD